MDNSSFNDWLQLYGKAWTQRRPDLITELFTQDAKYSEKPFSSPFEGIDAITLYWKGVSHTQKDISFEYKIISVNTLGPPRLNETGLGCDGVRRQTAGPPSGIPVRIRPGRKMPCYVHWKDVP